MRVLLLCVLLRCSGHTPAAVTTFICVCVVPVVTSEILDASTQYTLQALALLFATFTVMMVIFAPKLLLVLRGKDDEYSLSNTARSNKTNNFAQFSGVGGGSPQLTPAPSINLNMNRSG